MQQRLAPIAERHHVQLELEPMFLGVPSFKTPESEPLVALAEKLTGYGSQAVAFATEAPFL